MTLHNTSTLIETINKTLENKGFKPELPSTLLWLFFLGNGLLLILYGSSIIKPFHNALFRLNGFTYLIWTTVSFFSAIVGSYSSNYLKGVSYKAIFSRLTIGFTLSVMLFVASNHVFAILCSWFIMGIFMSKLIGIDKTWGDAKEAARYTQNYFTTGTLFLSTGVLLLAFSSGRFTLIGLNASLSDIPNNILVISAICIITAAAIQSAMFPFQKWLLSAMTAPTPASALMHAGFVNGAGLLLALLASVIVTSNTLNVLFIIGGLTALIAQFTKLLQVNVKQKLACSTIAQMGFMIMQCGLGFFNAAVVHLILHGFYKAYLFLSSGEDINESLPTPKPVLNITPLQSIIVLIFGLLGAFVFTQLTGKGYAIDSRLFLTVIVAITVGQITYNIVKEKSLSILQKILFPPVLFISGIVVYALMYNGVTSIMTNMPLAGQPTEITWIQIIFGMFFLVGFFIMKLGIYKKFPWLYVKLMTLSQPYKKTVLMYKSN